MLYKFKGNWYEMGLIGYLMDNFKRNRDINWKVYEGIWENIVSLRFYNPIEKKFQQAGD